jgi:hypothetical protein
VVLLDLMMPVMDGFELLVAGGEDMLLARRFENVGGFGRPT